jgi:hypothetical protein
VKGLDLAREYFHAHGAPMIRDKFGDYAGRVAAGLVGSGSECFGVDDEISRDHDWGPGFCLWLTAEDHAVIGGSLQREYERLPAMFKGFGPRIASPGEESRMGVSEIGSFYVKYTGLDHAPSLNQEWLRISESALGACTNGEVFSDPLGTFTGWRESLLRFYPEDVRLKKIASRCFTMAQTGQYNFERSLKRGENFAASYAEAKFCFDAISLVFLMNRRYAPFYKWMHRVMRGLPILGIQVSGLIDDLVNEPSKGGKVRIMEAISRLVIEELRREGLSDASSGFLLDHAHSVHGRIRDEKLRERFAVVQ